MKVCISFNQFTQKSSERLSQFLHAASREKQLAKAIANQANLKKQQAEAIVEQERQQKKKLAAFLSIA